ncbi:hypothetical protein ARMGADRAFT_577560 [Armillaria gallica]|uniref:Uncharacterized protein n=1 Tax=Armillaria gallica TaxID=47427 RepID=A0A2H3DTB9_ARMGA|nr:hypothetical protein ARMGADRAFT_577560 [Armillaria gallica]
MNTMTKHPKYSYITTIYGRRRKCRSRRLFYVRAPLENSVPHSNSLGRVSSADCDRRCPQLRPWQVSPAILAIIEEKGKIMLPNRRTSGITVKERLEKGKIPLTWHTLYSRTRSALGFIPRAHCQLHPRPVHEQYYCLFWTQRNSASPLSPPPHASTTTITDCPPRGKKTRLYNSVIY